MRWGSLLSTLLLTGGSVVLPRLAFNAMGMDQGKLASTLGSLQSLQGGNLDAGVMKQLQALQSGQTETLPLEQLAALQDIAQAGGGLQKQAGMAQALISALKNQKPLGTELRGQVLRESERARAFYRGSREKVLAILCMGVLLTLAVLVLGALPFGRGLARFYLTFTFALAGRWLVMVSFLAVAYFAASKLNPWPLLPGEILYAPVGYMLVAGLFLRLLDPNYPLWNSLLRSLGAPVVACLAIVGMGLGPGLLAGH